MRRQLIVAGISAALLAALAASPVLADAGAGGRISGQARTASAAWMSVEVRQNKLAKGEFNYTSLDGRFHVRCNGFDSYSPRVYIVAGAPAATVKGDCVLTGPRNKRTPVTVEAEFVDNSSFTRHGKDEANLTFTRPDGSQVVDRGRILSGDIRVR